jgi:hypothetical protein
MNKQYVIISIIIGLILVVVSCTDLKKDLPVASSGTTKIHDAGWSDQSSSNFHGKYLKDKDYNTDVCTSCHAKNLLGGVSKVSCNKCHHSFPHNDGWEDDTSKINFHGKYLKAKNWNSNECKNCHGAAYTGGTSGKACYQCHPSFPHEVKFAVEGGHAGYMEQNGYPISDCKKCHGANFAGGGIVNISCSQSDCHRDAGGNTKSPEACNTCHGVFLATANDTITWAPPRALNGDTLETSPGVGAHQAHLAEGEISSLIKCNQCHNIPAIVTATGHLDTPLPADVKFDTSLAGLKSADHTFNPNPSFNYSSLKCNNTFCHGNWKVRQETSIDTDIFTDTIMTGAAYAPTWTAGANEITCGKCHGLPPNGHSPEDLSECGDCHSGIVDLSGVIVKKEKHINGKINVYGMELNF